MIPDLEIYLATDIKEALGMLKSEDARIIAGGTDVVPGLSQGSNRFKDVRVLVDINHISQLKGISVNDGIISIGATETFSDLLESEIVKNELPLLWKSAATIGSVQIRNRATIAGNFVNNAPCADSIPPLLVYDAVLEIESFDSKREITLADFLTSPYKTKIEKNEIVTKINIPLPSKELRGDFYKLGRRRAVAVSRITLALLVKINEHAIDDIKIASGAVSPIGTRFYEIENYALGKKVNEQLMKNLSREIGEKIIELTGLRWSSEYKLPVVQQVFYQLINTLTQE